MSLVTKKILDLVGTTVTYRAATRVSTSDIAYFRLVVDSVAANSNLSHLSAASRPKHEPECAPPTLICETNQHINQAPTEFGFTGHLWDLGLNGCQMIRAGNRYTFHRSVRVGDTLGITVTLTNVWERAGSDGQPLLFVDTSYDYFGISREDRIAENVETMVYLSIRGRNG